MDFDTKIKIVLRSDLAMWQKLNVTAFLMSGIAGTQDIVGAEYVDRDETKYLPMSKQPIMVYAASGDEIKGLLDKALDKDVVMAIFTEELFGTFNDDDNRAMVAKFGRDDLNLVGMAMRGKKNVVDRLFKGFTLHEEKNII